MVASAFAAGWLTGATTASLTAACAVLLAAAVGSGVFVDAVAAAAIGDAAAADAGLAGAFVARSIGAWATAGFDASTVDVLVAIAAAAIARGSVALPVESGATTMPVAATGIAIAKQTGAGVTAVDAAGCDDAAGSGGAAASGEAMMSEAASLTVVFTMPDFADPNLGLEAAPVSALPSAAAD